MPPELWLEVFRWATASEASNALFSTDYAPFQVLPLTKYAADPSLKVKRTLVLVCRQWKELAVEFLYEDVKIRNSVTSLIGVLEDTGSANYGRLVRRAELPYEHTTTPTRAPLSALDVLKLCSDLEILTRPMHPLNLDAFSFEFSADCVKLPSLKRLEWWHNNDASRTGGINSLCDVLRCCPNLQYLSVGGIVWLNLVRLESMSLPRLKTLQLCVMKGMLIRQVCRWNMPALENLVLESCIGASSLEFLWEHVGPQIKTVELGKHLRFYLEDYLTAILAGCSDVEKLYYHVHFTLVPTLREEYPSVKRIGVHCSENMFVPDPEWLQIKGHFAMFASGSLPSLERIQLFGEWDSIVADPRFAPLYEDVVRLGRVLVDEKGRVIRCNAQQQS